MPSVLIIFSIKQLKFTVNVKKTLLENGVPESMEPISWHMPVLDSLEENK